ncbi:MAG: hypothetical protein ACT4R6_11250 [Gemmatimonadaceae bacterium]
MPNEVAVRPGEAAVMAAYLGTAAPPRDIVQRYESWAAADAAPADSFDGWLLALGSRHALLTSIADTYARIARPYGALRRRLTLMLALLETHGATHAGYDTAAASGRAAAWLALAAAGTCWGLRLVAACVVCAPAHTAVALADMLGGRRTA